MRRWRDGRGVCPSFRLVDSATIHYRTVPVIGGNKTDGGGRLRKVLNKHRLRGETGQIWIANIGGTPQIRDYTQRVAPTPRNVQNDRVRLKGKMKICS